MNDSGIIKKSIGSSTRGLRKKYSFDELTPGYCLIVDVSNEDYIGKRKRKASVYQALEAYKRRHNPLWETRVLLEGDIVEVYRIK